jgi:hypothetical protein
MVKVRGKKIIYVEPKDIFMQKTKPKYIEGKFLVTKVFDEGIFVGFRWRGYLFTLPVKDNIKVSPNGSVANLVIKGKTRTRAIDIR